jgi:hypothetical protein
VAVGTLSQVEPVEAYGCPSRDLVEEVWQLAVATPG